MSGFFRPALAALLVLPLLFALTPRDAQATRAYSWNLSRDLLTPPATNPDGAWTFMQSTAASPTALGSYTPIAGPPVTSALSQVWQAVTGGLLGVTLTTTASLPWPQVNFVNGMPVAHPGFGAHVAVKWTNPTSIMLRPVHVVGRITDIDGNGGDGVNYHVVQQSTAAVLASGTVFATVDPDGRAFYINTFVPPGDSIYFIIERRTGYNFDTTEIDLFIAGS